MWQQEKKVRDRFIFSSLGHPSNRRKERSCFFLRGALFARVAEMGIKRRNLEWPLSVLEVLLRREKTHMPMHNSEAERVHPTAP